MSRRVNLLPLLVVLLTTLGQTKAVIIELLKGLRFSYIFLNSIYKHSSTSTRAIASGSDSVEPPLQIKSSKIINLH